MALRGDRDQSSAAIAWYGLGVLIAVSLLGFLDRQIINLVAPMLQAKFGWSDLQIGALQGLGMAVFATAAAYPVGWLADRFGRRLILSICLIIWSGSTLACAFQNSFNGFLAATSGIAIGEAAMMPIIFALIPDLFAERQRNAANFVCWAAACLGMSAGLGMGGLTLDWLANNQQHLPSALASMESWRAAMILVVIPAPLLLVLMVTVRVRRDSAASDGVEVARSRFIPFIRRRWQLFLYVFAIIAAYCIPVVTPFPWLPIAMTRIYEMAPAMVGVQLGSVAALASIAGVLLPGLGSLLLTGTSEIKPIRLALIFASCGLIPSLLLLIATSPMQIYVVVGAQFAFGLAIGALMPGVLQTLAPPDLRSRLLAGQGVVASVATGTAPILVGALSGLLPSSRGILTAITIVSVPAWLIIGVASVLVSKRLHAR
jgi:MFS family permease